MFNQRVSARIFDHLKQGGRIILQARMVEIRSRQLAGAGQNPKTGRCQVKAVAPPTNAALRDSFGADMAD